MADLLWTLRHVTSVSDLRPAESGHHEGIPPWLEVAVRAAVGLVMDIDS